MLPTQLLLLHELLQGGAEVRVRGGREREAEAATAGGGGGAWRRGLGEEKRGRRLGKERREGIGGGGDAEIFRCPSRKRDLTFRVAKR